MAEERQVGEVVKWLNQSYGFLRDANENDYFVHFNSIHNKRSHEDGFLKVGDFCEFNVIRGKNGFEAIDVVIL